MKRKDKKAEERAKRAKRKKQLAKNKAKKRRRGGTSLERAIPSKEEKERLLIVCEGENTEPSYFNKFRLTSATIKAIGEGYNTISLVERAYKFSKQEDYDQVWCVFDKDDFPNEDFNKAIQVAQKYNFRVAYSNQAFEYWIILHFEDHQGGAMHRDTYHGKINKYLKVYGIEYDKDSKMITDEIFETLQSRSQVPNIRKQDQAVRRAKRIYKQFDHSSPAKEESSTTVFRLVEEIERFL